MVVLFDAVNEWRCDDCAGDRAFRTRAAYRLTEYRQDKLRKKRCGLLLAAARYRRLPVASLREAVSRLKSTCSVCMALSLASMSR